MILWRKDDGNSVGRVSACCSGVKKEEGGELPPPDLRSTGEADRISARRKITSRSLWRMFVFSENLTCKNWQINSNFTETKESLFFLIFLNFFFFLEARRGSHAGLAWLLCQVLQGCLQREGQDPCRHWENDTLLWPALGFVLKERNQGLAGAGYSSSVVLGKFCAAWRICACKDAGREGELCSENYTGMHPSASQCIPWTEQALHGAQEKALGTHPGG